MTEPRTAWIKYRLQFSLIQLRVG